MAALDATSEPVVEPPADASVAVVIPAYNEAATIAGLARRTLQQPVAALIVVDDGSTDATAGELEGLPLTLLRHPDNRGKAASLWTGIERALAQDIAAVVTLDGDGQHRPEDLGRLLAAARRYPEAIIVAARLRGRAGVPKARRFANAMADFWISWAAGYPIRDTQSGFRLYPAALLRQLDRDRRHDRRRWRGRGFVFESEVLIEAARHRSYVRNVTISADYPPTARRSHYRPWRDTWLIVRMVAWKLLSRGLYLPGLLRARRLLPDPRD